MVISNAGSVSLRSAAVWCGYAIAITAFLVNTGLPALDNIWHLGLPITQMQETWNQFGVPFFAGFGVHAARLWNQNLPNGGVNP